MHQSNPRRRQALWTPFRAVVLLLGVATLAASIGVCNAQEYLTGIEWQEPPVIKPGKNPGDPPSDAIILFDGKNFDAWNGAEKWKIEDGVAIVGGGAIETKQKFGDSQLHVEWSAPVPATGRSQGRGNSGVFFGDYELQVLDSYENDTYYDGQAGAIYKQHPPMVNAMRPPGEWNVYDVIWTAPRFDDNGKLKSPAYITVLHNGVVVQNHFELLGGTYYNRPPEYHPPSELPVRLQDHLNPVKFRNIWIRPLKPIEGKQTREPFLRQDGKETPIKKSETVSGIITINGQKLAGGKITLHSKDSDRTFSDDVQDGAFSIDAVPAGDYIVTFGSNAAGDSAQIPAKYDIKEASGLTVTVAQGGNEFNFELASR